MKKKILLFIPAFALAAACGSVNEFAASTPDVRGQSIELAGTSAEGATFLQESSGVSSQDLSNPPEYLARTRAAIKGLEPTEVGSTVVVYTASQVVQQGMATWIHKWLQNNWRTSNGQMVDNQDLWQKLWALTQERMVQWEWLGGHLAHGKQRD